MATIADSATITITAAEPIVIDPADTKRRPALTPQEARLLTADIRHTTSRLWLLVTEAHDRTAHVAMGYNTWDDYVRAELDMSPSRSYQLLDTGHVMREMAAAGVDIDTAKIPTARVVARVKNRMPQVRRILKQAVKTGTPPEDALKVLAREAGKVPEAVEPPPIVKKQDGRRNAQVTCPACNGDGKVSRSLAGRLRAWVRTTS